MLVSHQRVTTSISEEEKKKKKENSKLLLHNLPGTESVELTGPQNVFLAEQSRAAVTPTFDLSGKYHSAAQLDALRTLHEICG